MRRRFWGRIVLLTATMIAVGVSGVVLAEWLVRGSGQGSGIAGDVIELRVDPVSTIADDAGTKRLVPGGTGDSWMVIHNDNTFDVEVREVTQDGAITSDTAGCEDQTAQVSFITQTGAWVVLANDSLAVKLADALAMGPDAADQCRNAVFTVPVVVSGGTSPGSIPFRARDGFYTFDRQEQSCPSGQGRVFIVDSFFANVFEADPTKSLLLIRGTDTAQFTGTIGSDGRFNLQPDNPRRRIEGGFETETRFSATFFRDIRCGNGPDVTTFTFEIVAEWDRP